MVGKYDDVFGDDSYKGAGSSNTPVNHGAHGPARVNRESDFRGSDGRVSTGGGGHESVPRQDSVPVKNDFTAVPDSGSSAGRKPLRRNIHRGSGNGNAGSDNAHGSGTDTGAGKGAKHSARPVSAPVPGDDVYVNGNKHAPADIEAGNSGHNHGGLHDAPSRKDLNASNGNVGESDYLPGNLVPEYSGKLSDNLPNIYGEGKTGSADYPTPNRKPSSGDTDSVHDLGGGKKSVDGDGSPESGDGDAYYGVKPNAPNRPVGQRKTTGPSHAIDMGQLGNIMDANRLNRLAASGMYHASNIAHTAGNALKSMARTVKNGAVAVYGFVTNPACWVSILVVLAMMLCLTGIQTFGPQSIDCNALAGNSNFMSSGSSTNGTVAATSGKSIEEFVDKYGQIAFDMGKKFGLPYEAVLGQAIEESGYGTSNLAVNNHNFFGMKNTAGGWQSFANDKEGWEGYGHFMTDWDKAGYYKDVVKHHTDPEAYAKALQDSPYCATDNDGNACAYYEHVWAHTQGVIKYIQSKNLFPPSSEANKDFKESDLSSSDSSSSDIHMTEAVTINCVSNGSANGSTNGAVNGIKECDEGNCTYEWMCEIAGVCKNGDGLSTSAGLSTTPAGSSTNGKILVNGVNYQCVWYAWARLSLLHPNWKDGTWGVIFGNGNQIGPKAAATDGWITTTTDPKPGDGLSFQGYNHVAVVEKVEGNKVYISEGNYSCSPMGSGCWNGYNTRWIDKNADSPIYFRHSSW